MSDFGTIIKIEKDKAELPKPETLLEDIASIIRKEDVFNFLGEPFEASILDDSEEYVIALSEHYLGSDETENFELFQDVSAFEVEEAQRLIDKLLKMPTYKVLKASAECIRW